MSHLSDENTDLKQRVFYLENRLSELNDTTVSLFKFYYFLNKYRKLIFEYFSRDLKSSIVSNYSLNKSSKPKTRQLNN